MSCFGGDPNFCPECGNVLPLPGIQDTVRCPRCSFCIPVADFNHPIHGNNPRVDSRISCLAEKIWQIFHGCNPHTQLCCSSHKCMFLTNVAPFKREINRLSKEFSGQEIHSTVIFNPVEQSSVALEDEEDSELKGPVIDRRCSRCNKEGMVYHTRQMRSADEGQTVFFTCTHCRYQEKEDS